jgi:hypothetical protein
VGETLSSRFAILVRALPKFSPRPDLTSLLKALKRRHGLECVGIVELTEEGRLEEARRLDEMIGEMDARTATKGESDA